MKRGGFIVIEGIDRTGKSTQCKALVEGLKKKFVQAEYANFPNRQTEIGKVINSYLTSKTDLSDEAIHLLFSANRWERASYIKKMLEAGVTLIVDRYCFSGVAFSAAKGLDLKWCQAPDAGLPRPDRVFFLTMPTEIVQQRKGFGDERYEVLEFQSKVSEMYEKLKDETWEVIDASGSFDDIYSQLLDKCLTVVNNIGQKPIDKIWQDI